MTFRLTHLFTTRGATFPHDCPEPPPEGWPGCGLQSLHYTYDPVGNITHIRDDAQQRIFFKNKRVDPDADYTYDAVYRLVAATGREHLGQKNGNREPIPIGHDDSLRMNRPHPNEEKAMGRYQQQYLYDEVGNILKTIHKGTDPAHPGWTRTYSYNEPSLLDGSKKNNRLSSTTLDQVVEDYLHDAHGNIERMPHLASHGDPKKPNMRWDFEDQLCQVDLAGGGKAFYVYDAEGQRVRKVIHRQNGTRHKERIYLGEFEIYREYKGNGDDLNLERETLHVMDDEQRIALVETKTFELVEDDSENRIDEPVPVIRYQLGNHLDSASLELDVKGKVISYEEYYPYGSTSYQAGRNQAKVSLKRYRYTGKERDEESGFYYHGARYYVPWLGRWISPDPAALVDGLNLYVYTRCNPLFFRDPNGEWSWGRALGIVAAVVVGVGVTVATAGLAAPLFGTVAAGIIGGVVGGAIGAGTGQIVEDLVDRGRVNWTNVGIAAGIGAVFGGIFSGVGAGISRGLATETGRVLSSRVVNSTLGQLVARGVYHVASSAIGRGAGAVGNLLRQGIQRPMQRAGESLGRRLGGRFAERSARHQAGREAAESVLSDVGGTVRRGKVRASVRGRSGNENVAEVTKSGENKVIRTPAGRTIAPAPNPARKNWKKN